MGLGFLNKMVLKPSGINLDGLIRYYKFDNDFVDATGNQDGVLITPLWDYGVYGNALANDDNHIPGYIDDNDELSFVNISFAFSFWFKINKGDLMFLFSKRADAVTAEYQVAVNPNRIRTALFTDLNNYNWREVTYTLSVNTWYHAILYFDANGELYPYLNGQLQPTTDTYSKGTYTGMTNKNAKLSMMNPECCLTYKFDGAIDNFGIWRDTEFDSNRAMQLYNAELISPII